MSDQHLDLDLSTDGFSALDYPGPSFRPIPEFTLDVPPGWLVQDFPGALGIVGTPVESEDPWSNVIIKHQRVLATAALEEIALETWESLERDFPAVELVEERIVEFEQFQFIREVRLDLDGERVTRLDALFFGPIVDEVTTDLFHVICMHPVAADDERTLTYLKMLASFRFVAMYDDGETPDS